MKKYTVKDEDGKVVEVTEYEKGEAPVAAAPAPAEEKGDKPNGKALDEVFSEEQLAEIKRIVTEAITAALHPDQPAAEGDKSAPEGGEVKEKEEEIVKAGDSVKAKDSKTTPGAIPQKVQDSVVNDEDIAKKENEINSAWENRWK